MSFAPNDTYWWIHTGGYHMQHSLVYLNKDNQWRLDVNDKTVFISTQTLERMFGKGCILRPLDVSTDQVEAHTRPKNNAFLPCLLDEDGVIVILINPAINMAMINGALVPASALNVKGPLVFDEPI